MSQPIRLNFMTPYFIPIFNWSLISF